MIPHYFPKCSIDPIWPIWTVLSLINYSSHPLLRDPEEMLPHNRSNPYFPAVLRLHMIFFVSNDLL